MIFRIRFVLIFVVCFSMLASCAFTPMLYYKDKPYLEEISSILVSADRKNIIVVSHKYHYIFDAPSIIIDTLDSTHASKVTVQFSKFHVDIENTVVGSVTLDLTNATESDIISAIDSGFRVERWLVAPTLVDLKGVRYAANENIADTQSYKLTEKHVIQVVESLSPIGKTIRTALTPIALAADGVLVMGGVVLLPVFFTVVAIAWDP